MQSFDVEDISLNIIFSQEIFKNNQSQTIETWTKKCVRIIEKYSTRGSEEEQFKRKEKWKKQTDEKVQKFEGTIKNLQKYCIDVINILKAHNLVEDNHLSRYLLSSKQTIEQSQEIFKTILKNTMLIPPNLAQSQEIFKTTLNPQNPEEHPTQGPLLLPKSELSDKMLNPEEHPTQGPLLLPKSELSDKMLDYIDQTSEKILNLLKENTKMLREKIDNIAAKSEE